MRTRANETRRVCRLIECPSGYIDGRDKRFLDCRYERGRSARQLRGPKRNHVPRSNSPQDASAGCRGTRQCPSKALSTGSASNLAGREESMPSGAEIIEMHATPRDWWNDETISNVNVT